tara:strand:+ start:580 stop:918 length:339 start_codon:yes stop_codon:yes gene_type:complete
MKNETKEKRATFTPGPWHAFEQTYAPSNRGLFEVDASGPSGNRQTVAVTPLKGDGNEMWANARLIAAAPELHAQAKILERLLTELSMEGETGTDEALEEVRAVLAKVDGGEG